MKLPVKLVRATNSVATCLKANSPKILVGVGIISSIAAIADAIKQTPKAEEILEKHKDEIAECKEALAQNDPEYTEKVYKKDVFYTFVRTGGKLVKCYGRSFTFEAISIFSFCGAVKILNSRNKLLSSALAASIDAALADRKKVEEAIGEEAAAKIFNGTTEEKVTEEIVDENDKKKKVSKKISVVDPKNFESEYDILWMNGDPGWDPSPELRTYTVGEVAAHFNKILFDEKLVKAVSLNDVRKYFKKPSEAFTELGQVAGWNLKSDDQAVILRMREVSIPDPEDSRIFHDAVIISPNISGSIVESYVK